MFGIFKKRIPATERQRQHLVKRLFLHRCDTDLAAQVMAEIAGTTRSDIPAEMLMLGAPEATVLRVVEQFLTIREQGATEEFAVKTLNHMHSAALLIAGEPLDQNGASRFALPVFEAHC